MEFRDHIISRMLRMVAGILGIALLLLLLTFAFFYLKSPPDAGEPIAEAWQIPYPTVVAHRGASWVAPESTAPAYELARDMGAHYLEADLQRTRDGVVVAFHDRTLARTTSVEEVFPERANDPFETFTHDELMELDHGSWFNVAFPGRTRDSYEGLAPVTLEELITIAEEGSNNPGLYLETKDAERYPGIEEDILEILRNAGWYPDPPTLDAPDAALNERFGASSVDVASGPARIIVQSFSASSVDSLVTLIPDLPVVYLISRRMADADGFRFHLDRAVEMGAAGVGPDGHLGFPWHTRQAHARDLLVHHYTINEPWQMRLLRRFGGDGIFTDRPAVALETYGWADQVDVDAILDQRGY